MRGMAKGSLALPRGIVMLVLGRAAGAQTPLPEYEGVRVSPDTILTADTEVTVSGPAFPGQTGCRPGNILGIPAGGELADAVPLTSGDLNTPETPDDRGELTFLASSVPLATTTYTIYLDC